MSDFRNSRDFDPHRGWHRRGYLPHFDAGALVQRLTFRLADSLPRHVHESVLAAAKSSEERFKRLEAIVDQGRGACILRQPEVAEIVMHALQHFDGERYKLLAWVIMPNHVHALIEQITGFPLGRIMHSWKSFTANEISKLRGFKGSVWAHDYFDRFVRNAEHFGNAISYIEQNPVRAGLVRRSGDWLFSSARSEAE